MFFVFTYQHGLEHELFTTRDNAELEVARLRHLMAYRNLDIHIGFLSYHGTSLRPNSDHRIEVVDAC